MVESDLHVNDVDLVSRNHDVETAITSLLLGADDHGSELPEGHLEEIADSENCFLQLDCLHGVLGFLWVVFLQNGRVRLEERIVG